MPGSKIHASQVYVS